MNLRLCTHELFLSSTSEYLCGTSGCQRTVQMGAIACARRTSCAFVLALLVDVRDTVSKVEWRTTMLLNKSVGCGCDDVFCVLWSLRGCSVSGV